MRRCSAPGAGKGAALEQAGVGFCAMVDGSILPDGRIVAI